jgi:hypothetical protein
MTYLAESMATHAAASATAAAAASAADAAFAQQLAAQEVGGKVAWLLNLLQKADAHLNRHF